jgi:hypothetical protein
MYHEHTTQYRGRRSLASPASEAESLSLLRSTGCSSVACAGRLANIVFGGGKRWRLNKSPTYTKFERWRSKKIARDSIGEREEPNVRLFAP